MRKGVLRPESFHERTFCRAFFKKTAEIHIMSIESYPEAQAASESYLQQPPARKGSGGVRIVIYVVLVAFVALVVWKIYQTQQTAKSQASSAAAALAGRAVPVQVAAAVERPMPIFLTALGTVTPYMSVTVKARVSGELEPV